MGYIQINKILNFVPRVTHGYIKIEIVFVQYQDENNPARILDEHVTNPRKTKNT